MMTVQLFAIHINIDFADHVTVQGRKQNFISREGTTLQGGMFHKGISEQSHLAKLGGSVGMSLSSAVANTVF